MSITLLNYYSEQMSNLIKFKGEDCGLYRGKAGKAVLLYLLSELDNKHELKDAALQLLDEISESIAKIDYWDFANGLAGIGWAVEWVAQNGFLEINTDEILEDLDDALYKSVLYSSDKNISLASGTLGKLLFFFSRYKSKNPYALRLKNIFHEECLVLLTDDLYEKITGDEGLIKKREFSDEDLINIGHLIYFISDFLWLKVNEPTVETLLYETIKFSDDFIGQYLQSHQPSEKSSVMLFLSFCYYLAGKNHKQNLWQSRALHFLENIQPIYNANYKLRAIEILNEIFGCLIEDEVRDKNLRNIDSTDVCLANEQGKVLLYNLLQKKGIRNDFAFWANLLIML